MHEKITLNEWISLPLEQRDEIQAKWKQDWSEWYYLLDEAIESFKGKYGEIPEISRVDPAYESELVNQSSSIYKLVAEPWIGVTTSLMENQYIKELPSEYAHFKVIQEPFGSTGQAYLQEWKLILKNLLGWTEEKVVAWALEHHSGGLKGKDIWFDHEWPSYYVTNLLVPENKLMFLVNDREMRILERITGSFYSQNSNPLHADYDWNAAHQRVNDILKEINASLPV